MSTRGWSKWGAAKRKKGNKYGAKRATSNLPELAGRSFHSQLERDRAGELVILLRAGAIRDLVFQPRVMLTEADISYHADFSYQQRNATGDWQTVYEEAKGMEGDRWRIIRALWRVYGPGTLLVTKRVGDGGIMVADAIVPRCRRGRESDMGSDVRK